MHDCSTDCALHRAAARREGPSRREFISATVLASVGGFLAACGDNNIGGVDTSDGGGVPSPVGGQLLVTLAAFPALAADGGIARVDGGSRVPIAVTRVSATNYLAFSMICTHARYRPINIVAAGFECPNHGAQFHPNGQWRGGQLTTGLDQYTVVLDAGAGTLTISPLIT